MKRMKRNPTKFGVLELFSAIARTKDLRINSSEDLKNFTEIVFESLKESQATPTVLHGKRVEAMFGYIAAALGGCKFIKTEDAGDMFVKGLSMQSPDYRVILNDGTAMLIEVKNFHSKDPYKRFTLTRKYFEEIERYAAMLLSCTEN